jgi:hypothetical protein
LCPDTSRHSRQEAEEELRKIEEFEHAHPELHIEEGPDDLLFPRDLRLHEQEPPQRGIVGSVRVPGRRIQSPRVMSRREWRLLLADCIY